MHTVGGLCFYLYNVLCIVLFKVLLPRMRTKYFHLDQMMSIHSVLAYSRCAAHVISSFVIFAVWVLCDLAYVIITQRCKNCSCCFH